MHDTIEFGGRERPIAFTSGSVARLQRRFRFPNAATWLLNDVLGCDVLGGTNTSFNLDARFAVLGAALECGAKKTYPPAKVEEWYDQAIRDSVMHQALWAAVACAFESGAVTGRVVDDFDKKSGVLRAVFFAATPQELEAALTAAAAHEDETEARDGDGGATPVSTTTSCAVVDAA